MTDTDAITAKSQLRSFVERVERLDEEIKELNNDKRDIYQEVRHSGFDVKAVKAVIRLRAQDPGERAELDVIVKTYLSALGMAPDSGDAVADLTDIQGSSLELEEAA